MPFEMLTYMIHHEWTSAEVKLRAVFDKTGNLSQFHSVQCMVISWPRAYFGEKLNCLVERRTPTMVIELVLVFHVLSFHWANCCTFIFRCTQKNHWTSYPRHIRSTNICNTVQKYQAWNKLFLIQKICHALKMRYANRPFLHKKNPFQRF